MTSPGQRLDQARLALMLLTRLPVGRLSDPAPGLASAAWAFPLVGLVVGVIGWAVHGAALALGLPHIVAALGALAAMALTTGGLHLDGLADFADGIGGGRDRAHRLEIMRDSHIGSYGVIALIFALGLSAGALSGLPATTGLVTGFLLIGCASRLLMLLTLILLPPARTDGLGNLAHRSGGYSWVAGAVVSIALVAMLGPSASAVLGAMAVAAVWVAWRAKNAIGGHSGDVLGAVQVLSETAGWVALAASLQ